VETEIVPSINPVESAERLSMLAAPMAGIPQVRVSPVQQVFCKPPAVEVAEMAETQMAERQLTVAQVVREGRLVALEAEAVLYIAHPLEVQVAQAAQAAQAA
jgi:hypothetical protein